MQEKPFFYSDAQEPFYYESSVPFSYSPAGNIEMHEIGIFHSLSENRCHICLRQGSRNFFRTFLQVDNAIIKRNSCTFRWCWRFFELNPISNLEILFFAVNCLVEKRPAISFLLSFSLFSLSLSLSLSFSLSLSLLPSFSFSLKKMLRFISHCRLIFQIL